MKCSSISGYSSHGGLALLTTWVRGKIERNTEKNDSYSKALIQLEHIAGKRKKKKPLFNFVWLAFTVHLFSQEVIFISKTNFPPSPQPE